MFYAIILVLREVPRSTWLVAHVHEVLDHDRVAVQDDHGVRVGRPTYKRTDFLGLGDVHFVHIGDQHSPHHFLENIQNEAKVLIFTIF